MTATRILWISAGLGAAVAAFWMVAPTSNEPASAGDVQAFVDAEPTTPHFERDRTPVRELPPVDEKTEAVAVTPVGDDRDAVNEPSSEGVSTNAAVDDVHAQAEAALARAIPRLREACWPASASDELRVTYALDFDADGTLGPWALSPDGDAPSEILDCLARQPMDLVVSTRNQRVAAHVPLTLR
jgi:hypothetical protein